MDNRAGPSLRLLIGLLVAVGAVVGLAGPASAADGDRVVRVGTEGTYPPFTYQDPRTDQLTGYDIEVVEAVAEKAGWRLRYVQSTFDAIFPALDADRIDVIANQVTINPEREAKYLFSEPYTYSRGVIVTAKGNPEDISTLADLQGRTTAQSETSNWAQVARDAGARVESVEGFAQAAELLAQGRVDAIVNDNIAVLDYLASTGSDDVEIVGDAGEDVSRQALTFRQSDADLQQEADAALRELRDDGTLAKISEKYFRSDVSVEDPDEVEVKGSDTRGSWEVLTDTAWPMLKALVVTTIPLTILSFAIGLAIALLVALAVMSGNRLLRAPARFYISAIRGTPLLVQLFIVFYGLAQVGIKLPGFTAAVLALSLNVGGYAAEIVRASILSVPRGQFEAATVIGMDYRTSLRRIVLPQAARIAVPPLSNTLLSLVKDTSLVSVVLVTDLFRVAQTAAAPSQDYLQLYAFAALYYWVVCWLLARGQDRLELRLGRYAT